MQYIIAIIVKLKKKEKKKKIIIYQCSQNVRKI